MEISVHFMRCGDARLNTRQGMEFRITRPGRDGAESLPPPAARMLGYYGLNHKTIMGGGLVK